DSLRSCDKPISCSITHPTQQLCTLRGRRYRRLAQHSPPGGSLRLTWVGLAPTDRARLLALSPIRATGGYRAVQISTAPAALAAAAKRALPGAAGEPGLARQRVPVRL